MYKQESDITIDFASNFKGLLLLEFGANCCGFCKAAEAYLERALTEMNADLQIKHIKIEDGPGRKLGRSFKVKLWPTLILLQDGHELKRLVRPEDFQEVQAFLRK